MSNGVDSEPVQASEAIVSEVGQHSQLDQREWPVLRECSLILRPTRNNTFRVSVTLEPRAPSGVAQRTNQLVDWERLCASAFERVLKLREQHG